MLESAWLFVGLIALAATGVAVATSDDAIGIVAGTLGVIAWGIWSFGALNVEIRGETASTISMPTLTLLGLVLAMIPAYIALTGPVALIGTARDATPEDL